MLLTITNQQPRATDLGYLLHKNPARAQKFDLSFGKAHVFYPEASTERCTAVLLLDVDPVALVRRRGAGTLDQYVNDRPYAASSFLSVAISRVYGSALAVGQASDQTSSTRPCRWRRTSRPYLPEVASSFSGGFSNPWATKWRRKPIP